MSQETFSQRVLARAQARGTAEAFAFVHETDSERWVERLTYAELDAQAKDIASWLQERGLAGRQVLLLYPSGLPFVAAFLGCQYAGAVAVPAPLPAGERQFQRLSRIAADARVGAVLTTREHAPAVESWLVGDSPDAVPCVATDGGPVGDAAHWREPEPELDGLAFLQYTSGSTSEPKGVMVSHRNLMANEAAIQRSLGSDADSCLGSWLPLFHDMGLIGHVLHPLWLGARAALMAPETFLRRPVRWLEMIGDHGVTIGGGPNFGYDMCVRRVKDTELSSLDLSRWVQACNGAEPVRAETIDAFARRFAPAGFRPETFFPCYGMAETTLLVSGTPLGRPAVTRTVDTCALETGQLAGPVPGGATRTLVSSGVVRAEDFEVRIADPATLRDLGQDGVGEIWVRGESVATGYWSRPGATAEAFGARLTGADGAVTDGWLRTGDLGALSGGELYVTGRLKEMVVINGRNIYPHDVEAAARAAHPSLGTGAVFAVRPGGDVRERLVAVLEVRGAAGGPDTEAAHHQALLDGVQRSVSEEAGVPVGNVLLVAAGTVRRTTSGKVQRTLMRKLFLEGRLEPLLAVVEPAVEELVKGAPVGVS